jgi:hypothetical protein
VDIILGGHDHLYFVARGVDEWDNYDLSEHVLGAEEDNGDALVVKSGTDFRDLSEILLDIRGTPEGSIRKKLISRITGKRVLGGNVERLEASYLPRKASRDPSEPAVLSKASQGP